MKTFTFSILFLVNFFAAYPEIPIIREDQRCIIEFTSIKCYSHESFFVDDIIYLKYTVMDLPNRYDLGTFKVGETKKINNISFTINESSPLKLYLVEQDDGPSDFFDPDDVLDSNILNCSENTLVYKGQGAHYVISYNRTGI